MKPLSILLITLSIFTQSIIAQTYNFAAYKYCCVDGDTAGLKVNLRIIISQPNHTIHILSNPDKYYHIDNEADSVLVDENGSSCLILFCTNEDEKDVTILFVQKKDTQHFMFIIINADNTVDEYYATQVGKAPIKMPEL